MGMIHDSNPVEDHGGSALLARCLVLFSEDLPDQQGFQRIPCIVGPHPSIWDPIAQHSNNSSSPTANVSNEPSFSFRRLRHRLVNQRSIPKVPFRSTKGISRRHDPRKSEEDSLANETHVAMCVRDRVVLAANSSRACSNRGTGVSDPCKTHVVSYVLALSVQSNQEPFRCISTRIAALLAKTWTHLHHPGTSEGPRVHHLGLTIEPPRNFTDS